MSFTLAIIGRPNVGKSTLFNRLTGKRHASVDDTPGVTRDRRYGDAQVGPLHFRIIDTAGLDNDKNPLAKSMLKMTEAGMQEADVILMVTDARAGITEEDKSFAKAIRKQGKPVVLVMNKSEAGHARNHLAEALRLGFGDPVAISAEHGEGMVDLYDALAPFAKDEEDEENQTESTESSEEEDNQPLQIAVIGRPNAGKSTFINQILGQERLLTGPEAGLTRDAIAIDFTYRGRPLKLVDTAGMRRKASVVGKLEKLAVADTLRSIQYAHVVILMIDANMPLEKQDNTIAALVEREGRALVLAVNKWDGVKEKHAVINEIIYKLSDVMPQVKGVPVIPVSALTGKHVEKVMEAAFTAYDVWKRRIGTGELNRWLEKAIEKHSPPLVDGRRIKIRYATQNKTRPPSFVLFTNNVEKMPDSYTRYLVNDLRERFDLPGVPIRMTLKKNKNPYDDK